MRLLAWMLILCTGMVAFAQESPLELGSAGKSALYKEAAASYAEGKYGKTIDQLNQIEEKLLLNTEANRQNLGFVAYWKGISFGRLQEFPEAIKHFQRALALDFAPMDIHYEYGQALYASEKLQEARLQFRESLKRKFKRGVSLYYIGFISRELGERKKAFTFFKSIKKLGGDEVSEVEQAAEMQIGDLYLEQIEKRSDAFKTVDDYVIPQYQKALAVDPHSELAPVIQDKITDLQRKYDLVLFQLRNGRPTLFPPHFFRISQEFGLDTNVTFAPAETTIATSKQESLYSRSDFVGRYTFYYRDYLSISPELRFNYTRYFNREPEIFRNDNYLIAPGIRLAYEHTLWEKPASVLFDYDYNEARRDVDAKEELEFSSRSHTLMIGERFNYFNFGESIVRLRHRVLESYLSSSDSTLTSLVVEQIIGKGINTFLFYFSYDMMRVDNDIYNTNSFTLRGDIIFGRVRDWFTPSIGLALTSTDPINARDTRGRELLVNPNIRLSKTIGKHWRGNLKYEYQNNKSEDEGNFAYTKSLYAFELEYLF